MTSCLMELLYMSFPKRLVALRKSKGHTQASLAEASGIPRATLYYYFSSKDEILQFLLTRMLERLTDAVAAAEDPDAAIPDRLAAVVRAQLAHLGEFPATAQLLTANLGKAGKLPDLAAGINAAFLPPLADRVKTVG